MLPTEVVGNDRLARLVPETCDAHSMRRLGFGVAAVDTASCVSCLTTAGGANVKLAEVVCAQLASSSP
jgi:hypothetical protein